MRIICPSCGQHYDVDSDYVGEAVECEVCGTSFVVKQPTRIPLPQSRQSEHSQFVPALPKTECPPSLESSSTTVFSEKPSIKPLVCEMCGGSDLLKDNGVFVCQSCGTKYSLEEAKKMMIAGTVNVAGTVKVDMSERLQNLYKVARRAKDENNNEQAAKYYDLILQEDADSWEATFYRTYFKAMDCRIADIASSARAVQNTLKNVIDLIANLTDQPARTSAYKEVVGKVTKMAMVMGEAAKNYYDGISYNLKMNDSSYADAYDLWMSEIKDVCYVLGDILEQQYRAGDKAALPEIFTDIWDSGLHIHSSWGKDCSERELYIAKIREYSPDYEAPQQSFCYIATAVYGAYDCPEVWTLRRFRDRTLASTWYGRTFICIYYAISPRLLKNFGSSKSFQRFWRYWLDKLVKRLQSEGVESSPYTDPTNHVG